MIWYLVILVAAVVRHLISLKDLFWQTFLSLFLLVQSIGVKSRTELVVSERGMQSFKETVYRLSQCSS